MSFTGPPASPQAPAEGPPAAFPVPQPAAAGSRTSKGLLAVAIALLIVGAAAGLGYATFDSGPQVPGTWDPRVASIAAFVEAARGLRYEHPVRVYFLTPSEYSLAINGERTSAGSAASKARAKRTAAFERAIGFVQGEPDVEKAAGDLADSGTLAYYDFDRKIVNIRGTKLTVNTRVTLAHELTHALQDQQFDLSSRFGAGNSEQQQALRTIVEGDAMTVENRYIDTLTEDEKTAYRTEYQAVYDKSQQDLGQVATALQASQTIPYAIGQPYVGFVQATRGGQPDTARLDALMRRLPQDTAATFDPADASGLRVDVEPPRLSGITFTVDQVGAFSLYVMLSDRIDATSAMDAVDGWRGDAFRAAETKTTGAKTTGAKTVMCVAATFAMASTNDAKELNEAFSQWAAAMPDPAAITHTTTGRRVSLKTCDPGPTATAPGAIGKSSDALALPSNRLDLAEVLVTQGSSRPKALCGADKIVRELTPSELTGGSVSDERKTEIQQLLKGAAEKC